MDRSNFAYTPVGKPFDVGEHVIQQPYMIVRYKNAKTSTQAVQQETPEQTGARFKSNNKGSFGVSMDRHTISHSLEKPGGHPEDLRAAMKQHENLLLVVGYYIPGSDNVSTCRGTLKDSKEPPISWEQINTNEIYLVGYKMGVEGKGKKAYALVDPDSTGRCSITAVPIGVSHIFFLQHFLLMDAPKKDRERAVGGAVEAITAPTSSEESLKHSAKRDSRIYQEIPEKSFTTLSRLKSFISSNREAGDYDAKSLKEILQEIDCLGVGVKVTRRNANIVRMIYPDAEYTESHAKAALAEAKDLWPKLFNRPVMKKLDASRMYAVGYALQHGLAESITFDYDFMCPFLAMVVSLNTDKNDWSGQPSSPEWLDHVQEAYDIAASMPCAMNPEKPHPSETTIKGRAALAVLKTDLESLRTMIKASAASIAQHSARNLKYKLLPRPLSLEDALSKLSVGPDKTAFLSATDQMFRTIAEKYYELFIGPVLRHVDFIIQQVDRVVLEEEAEESDEEAEESDKEAEESDEEAEEEVEEDALIQRLDSLVLDKEPEGGN